MNSCPRKVEAPKELLYWWERSTSPCGSMAHMLVCALYAKAPVVHLPCLVRMLAAPLHFTRPFHHIHPPLPLRFHMLRSIQGREFATWGDRLCVRYAHSGCSCAILNRTMPDVLAPFHSYIPIHAPIQPSRASTCPFARSKTHLIAYVAARDSCTYASFHMAGRRRTSSRSLGAHDGAFCASR